MTESTSETPSPVRSTPRTSSTAPPAFGGDAGSKVKKSVRSGSGRKKPTAAGKAGRLVAAGAAVGASLAMVGTMAGAAANAAAEPAAEATTIRRVVVPQAAVSEPIVIVLPQQAGATTDPIVAPAAVPALPQQATAPALAAAVEPVAESGGS